MGKDYLTTEGAGPFSGPPGIGIDHYWIGQVAVVAVSGTVDMLTSPQLGEAISAVAEQSPMSVIVDLTKTEFLASSGLSVLIQAHTDLTPAARFAIVADGPTTSRPIKLLGLDKVLAVYPTLDDALTVIGAE